MNAVLLWTLTKVFTSEPAAWASKWLVYDIHVLVMGSLVLRFLYIYIKYSLEQYRYYFAVAASLLFRFFFRYNNIIIVFLSL